MFKLNFNSVKVPASQETTVKVEIVSWPAAGYVAPTVAVLGNLEIVQWGTGAWYDGSGAQLCHGR